MGGRGAVVLSIGDLAARTGLSVSAIRFYEAKGLIQPARNAGGQRRYVRADIRTLSFVLAAQKLGLSLAEIRHHVAKLPPGRAPNRADWTRIAKGLRGGLDMRIKGLERLRDRLDGCIGCGCLSLKRCALYNPDDRAAERGPGPRFILDDAASEPMKEEAAMTLTPADAFTERVATLAHTIDARAAADPDASYTAKILAKGPKKAAQKIVEEAGELAIAISAEDKPSVASEAADLLYHMLVGLRARGVSLNDVAGALAAREGRSGLEEKASRTGP